MRWDSTSTLGRSSLNPVVSYGRAVSDYNVLLEHLLETNAMIPRYSMTSPIMVFSLGFMMRVIALTENSSIHSPDKYQYRPHVRT